MRALKGECIRVCVCVTSQIDCYTVSLLPVKAAVDEQMRKLQEALVASLRRKVRYRTQQYTVRRKTLHYAALH